MHGRVLAAVLALMLLGQVGLAQAEGDFAMTDPAGDDAGPGSYVYPKNPAFEPYHGLFDLTSFTVSSDIKTVRFDLGFAELRNPWSAPEGFSHQLVEIYINLGRPGGRTQTLVPGAYVRFDPAYPWDVMLKIAPWESSEFISLGPDGQPRKSPLQAGVVGKGKIRLTVPLALLGEPRPSWRYYVLVASYDGFGEGNYRPVHAKPGEWSFGGGSDAAGEPQVLDLLAPGQGPYSQEKQLGSYDLAAKRLAVLMPVGPGFHPGQGGFPWWLLIAAGLLGMASALWYWYAPSSFKDKLHEAAGAWRDRLKRKQWR